MSGDWRTFQLRMNKRADQVLHGTAHVVRSVAFEAARQVILRTPVDTGRARSNWIMTLRQPANFSITPYAPGHHLGVQERANAAGAIGAAERVLVQHHPGDPIWITNNLLYIGELNRGKSKQAGSYFVQMGVVAGVLEANRLAGSMFTVGVRGGGYSGRIA